MLVQGTQPERPSELEIGVEHVFIRSNIVRVENQGTDEMPGFVGWEYEEEKIEKDEYIRRIAQTQESSTLETQSALAELAEIVLGGMA